MRYSLINKIAVLTILFSRILFSFCDAQTNASLQGQIIKSDGSALGKEKIFLTLKGQNKIADSILSDSNGIFQFNNLAFGNYTIGINVVGLDNSNPDVFDINALNPIKQNQHLKIEDGNLICIESNYSNIKDALENAKNVYSLNLNSLQFDVAEKSLTIGTDGTKKLSPKIGEFTNLESLSININLINSLPSEIGNLNKLTVLNANLNKLLALPIEMGNLKNLRVLDLGKNDFHLFPDLITKFLSLEILNFENNPITALSPTINELKNLKELNLSSCFDLLTLPPQIGELTNLETLNLSRCGKLKSLPEEIIKLKNLKLLDVTDTKISTKDFQKAVPGCEVRK